jgi:hypothetical protein
VRYKIVPPARDRAFLFDVRDALPLVPGSEDDCCTRIRDRTAVDSRADAREWLTFCQALGLAAETDGAYHRRRDEPAVDALAARLRDNVFPTRELLAVLESTGPLTAEAAFEALQDEIPRWERSRTADWEAEWRERIAHLLGWCVAFDLAERVDGAYRVAGSED